MITVDYKTETTLVQEVLKKPEFQTLSKPSLLQKMALSKKEYASVYFHSGALDKQAVEKIENAAVTIVNSHRVKVSVLEQCKSVDASCVEVVYPTFIPQEIEIKKARKDFLKELGWDKKTRILLFTANNLKTAGVKEFIQTILSLQSTNFRVIIASDKQQITNLKFQISKFNFEDRVILYEDFHNIDLLFAISDIYVLPTHNSAFSSNILKAMYYKNAVFTTANSANSEVVDVFATMSDPSDASLAFKIDALLSRNEDLKLIKKQNRKTAKPLVLEKAVERIENIAKVLKQT